MDPDRRMLFSQLSAALLTLKLTGKWPFAWGSSGDPFHSASVRWCDYLSSTVRGNSRLGQIIEGPPPNLDGCREGVSLPRPVLLWSTGDVLYRRAGAVCDFLKDALLLGNDWHVQRYAFRRVIEWFFSDAKGRAWVSAVPLKPLSGNAIRAHGARYIASEQSGQLLPCGRRLASDSNLGMGLPPLDLRGFRFVNRSAQADDPKEQFIVRTWLRELQTVDGRVELQTKRALFRAHAEVDARWSREGEYILGPQMEYNKSRTAFTTKHIWLAKAIPSNPTYVRRFLITLQPESAWTVHMASERSTLTSIRLQQPVERVMLEEAGVFHNGEK